MYSLSLFENYFIHLDPTSNALDQQLYRGYRWYILSLEASSKKPGFLGLVSRIDLMCIDIFVSSQALFCIGTGVVCMGLRDIFLGIMLMLIKLLLGKKAYESFKALFRIRDDSSALLMGQEIAHAFVGLVLDMIRHGSSLKKEGKTLNQHLKELYQSNNFARGTTQPLMISQKC